MEKECNSYEMNFVSIDYQVIYLTSKEREKDIIFYTLYENIIVKRA